MLAFSIPTIAQDQGQITNLSDDLSLERLSEGVFIVTHKFPWPANSLLVEMENSDLVLVDTPYTPDATKELKVWMEEYFGKRRLIEINTGFHVDNLGGNEYLLANGIPVYGLKLTARLVKERAELTEAETVKMLTQPQHKRFYDAHKALHFYPPDHLLETTGINSIPVGDETIEIYYPGETHTQDNSVVYFAGKNILFGGCMVKSLNSKNLGFTADANLDEWPKSIQKVIERYTGDIIVIPGHGNWGNSALLFHTLSLLKKKNTAE